MSVSTLSVESIPTFTLGVHSSTTCWCTRRVVATRVLCALGATSLLQAAHAASCGNPTLARIAPPVLSSAYYKVHGRKWRQTYIELFAQANAERPAPKWLAVVIEVVARALFGHTTQWVGEVRVRWRCCRHTTPLSLARETRRLAVIVLSYSSA